jgi:hypothetical protein
MPLNIIPALPKMLSSTCRNGKKVPLPWYAAAGYSLRLLIPVPRDLFTRADEVIDIAYSAASTLEGIALKRRS